VQKESTLPFTAVSPVLKQETEQGGRECGTVALGS
jgi:hypothetical protein